MSDLSSDCQLQLHDPLLKAQGVAGSTFFHLGGGRARAFSYTTPSPPPRKLKTLEKLNF